MPHLEDRCAQRDGQKLLNMCGQRSTTAKYKSHMPTKSVAERAEEQLIKPWRSLQCTLHSAQTWAASAETCLGNPRTCSTPRFLSLDA